MIVIKLFVIFTIAATLIVLSLVYLSPGEKPAISPDFPVPQIEYSPEKYRCVYTPIPPVIDGVLDSLWDAAAWTDYFTDIEGSAKPEPRFKTRAKMLWDAEYFYIAAEMEEPHVWGTLENRDDIIFYDNDFEVFIDPDGDTHEYYELEMNALNTVWDLLLIKPYRDGGPAVHYWDITGLMTGVYIDGTLNDPSDTDNGWTVETAFPWDALSECAHKSCPPAPGDIWRVNFSRVEWMTDIVDSGYVKRTDPETGEILPEDNWVWSPQGLVNMHYPEMWGLVQFVEAAVNDQFDLPPVENVKWALRNIYYDQRNYYESAGHYTKKTQYLPSLTKFTFDDYTWPPVIEVTGSQFEAFVIDLNNNSVVRIDQDGRSKSGNR